MFCVETLPAATQGPSPAVFYVLPLEPSFLISLPFAVFMVKRKESKMMLLQPHCLLWAFEGHFHRAALMTTTEVPEQRARGGSAVLVSWTLQCSELSTSTIPPNPAKLPL